MYVLKDKQKAPSHLLNTISNDKYHNMSPENQVYYVYLYANINVGDVKKREEEDPIHINGIPLRGELITNKPKTDGRRESENGSDHQDQTT